MPNAVAHRHDDLRRQLEALHLDAMAQRFAELALRAAKEGLSHEAYLYELVQQQREQREQRRVQRLLHQANLPREKTFRTLAASRLPGDLAPATRTPQKRGVPLRNGQPRRHWQAWGRQKSCPDDIGYVQQDREEMEVLFTFLAERYERRSVGFTTNLVFSEWQRIFKDPLTTMAALDRVIHHSVILDMMELES